MAESFIDDCSFEAANTLFDEWLASVSHESDIAGLDVGLKVDFDEENVWSHEELGQVVDLSADSVQDGNLCRSHSEESFVSLKSDSTNRSLSLSVSSGEEAAGVASVCGSDKKRPYECDHIVPGTNKKCGRSFSKLTHLKAHRMTHTGERPFVCKFEGCKKAFTQLATLKNHLLTHSGDRRHACPFENCGKRFSRVSTLRIHYNTHKGERVTHVCPAEDCDKVFTQLSSLRTHMRTHTGEKPFHCPYEGCGRSFNRQSNRKRHILTHQKKNGAEDMLMDAPADLACEHSHEHSHEHPHPHLELHQPQVPQHMHVHMQAPQQPLAQQAPVMVAGIPESAAAGTPVQFGLAPLVFQQCMLPFFSTNTVNAVNHTVNTVNVIPVQANCEQQQNVTHPQSVQQLVQVPAQVSHQMPVQTNGMPVQSLYAVVL